MELLSFAYVQLIKSWCFCQIDVFPVWNAWGHALNRMEHYAQARVKFKYESLHMPLYFVCKNDISLRFIPGCAHPLFLV